MSRIEINHKTCITCGKCVAVCPSAIFTQEKANDKIELQNIKSCIVCGHCVAICPTGSVKHSDFPEEKVTKIDRAQLPTPDQMMGLLKARRSNRAFSKKPIPTEMLDLILEAAHTAPTASNSQNVEYTLITSTDKLYALSKMTIDVFDSNVKKASSPALKPIIKLTMPEALKYLPTLKKIVEEFAFGRDRILRGATAVILIHTPKESRFGCADANLAYQNASLMAESLGIAHFYGGFVTTAISQDKGKKLKELFGIDRKVQAVMALGMPKFLYPNSIEKKPIVVDEI